MGHKFSNEEAHLGGLASLTARGTPYYEGWNTRYPKHFVSFCGMHTRAVETGVGVDPAFVRTLEGFKAFILYIGPVPVGMKKPTVGRNDHTLGYFKGNFAWQAHSENVRESGLRHALTRSLKMKNDPRFNRTREQRVTSAKVSAAIVGARAHICPHCGKRGKGNAMRQWHFDNCKVFKAGDLRSRSTPNLPSGV